MLCAGEGDYLVSENVFPRCESHRNRRGLGVAGAHQLHGRPLPLAILAHLIDLDPLEHLLVNIGAAVPAVGNVR